MEKNSNVVKLVALSVGTSKKGNPYGRMTIKKRVDGVPRVAEMFVSSEVAEKALSKGLIDDVDVTLEFGLDDFLRPTVTGIESVETEEFDFKMED